MKKRRALLACVASIGAACSRPSPHPGPASAGPASAEPAPSPPPLAAATADDPRFHADLLAIAAHYSWMSRADGTWWAPLDCKAPIHPAYPSKAEAGPHGRKLYTLFVKDLAGYAAVSGRKITPEKAFVPQELAAMSQVIVKEAWTPVEASAYKEQCPSPGMHSFLATVTVKGKAYRACEQAGLFILYKPASPTNGTDLGWVYGTVQYETGPDPRSGQITHLPRVTASGRIESCMGCHTKAPHGRLFGLPESE